jgi:hypothetical protein
MATSVHDHHLLQLTVDAAARSIRLRTANHYDGLEPDTTDVVFQEVEAYVLRGDALGTILFAIDTVDALSLYREHALEMQRTYADNGGHAPWTSSESDAEAFLAGSKVQGYRLPSSIGLNGAVWARHLSVTRL